MILSMRGIRRWEDAGIGPASGKLFSYVDLEKRMRVDHLEPRAAPARSIEARAPYLK